MSKHSKLSAQIYSNLPKAARKKTLSHFRKDYIKVARSLKLREWCGRSRYLYTNISTLKKAKQLFGKYIDKKFKSKNSPASNRELSHPFRMRIKDYCAFFVFCGGHFESLINMRSASAKSENRSLGLAGKFANSRLWVISVISVPDLAVADRARIKNSEYGRQNTTHARFHAR